MEYTREQMQLIDNGYQTMTIPQLEEITWLSRYNIVQYCKLMGYVPLSGRIDSTKRELHNPRPVKIAVRDGKVGDNIEYEKKPIVRPKAVYSNTNWEEKYL